MLINPVKANSDSGVIANDCGVKMSGNSGGKANGCPIPEWHSQSPEAAVIRENSATSGPFSHAWGMVRIPSFRWGPGATRTHAGVNWSSESRSQESN
jgi:hypothetical protein